MLNKLMGMREKLSPGLRKIIRNVGWLSGEKVLGMIVNLSVGIYVVRYLGSEDFGKLSYCLSLVGMFTAIAKLGLDAIVVRNLVQEEESTEQILGTAFILKFIASLATVALIIYVTSILNEDPQIYGITIIIALGLVFNSFEVIDFWFQSKVRSGSIVIVRSIQLILTSVTKLLFIALGLPLSAFVWLFLVDGILRAFGTLWIYVKQNKSIFLWKFNWAKATDMLRDSWPLILSGVMVTIYMKIDQVMLGNMASNEAVGNYAAAVRFSEVWYFVPIAICSSVFPSIIRAKQRSKQEYYDKLQQLYDLMAWMSLAIAIIMTFISGTLITTLLGEGYAEAGNILAWHIWAGPFVFLGVARGQWLIAENLTHFSFAITLLGAITNLLLNFLFIPHYEGLGAALATVISYGVSTHLACILYPPLFKSGWMLTKALLIPLRIHQNLNYIKRVKRIWL